MSRSVADLSTTQTAKAGSVTLGTATVVRLMCAQSDADSGWICRLLALGKGYKVYERDLPFGRSAVLIKGLGTSVLLTQGGQTAIKTTLQSVNEGQAQILHDLAAIGMLHFCAPTRGRAQPTRPLLETT